MRRLKSITDVLVVPLRSRLSCLGLPMPPGLTTAVAAALEGWIAASRISALTLSAATAVPTGGNCLGRVASRFRALIPGADTPGDVSSPFLLARCPLTTMPAVSTKTLSLW